MGLKRKELLIAVLFIAALSLTVFRSVVFSPDMLMTSDDNLGHIVQYNQVLPYAFTGSWADNGLLGQPSRINVGWTGALLYLLSPEMFTNWSHLLALLCGSVVLFLFLTRRLGLHWLAGLLGAITAYWLGSNLTLVFAGHIMKYGVICLSSIILFLLPLAVGSFCWAILCGGVLGFMFLEQQDSALFFGIFWGAYACFLLFRRKQPLVAGGAKLVVMLSVALLVALPGLLSSFEQNVTGVTSVQESTQQKWEFCTQWSWPPEESIDFIAPGYTGWRSGEPAGPYWGRMGRSAEWDTARQGFMNFKLETTYLGIIPVTLALFACVSAFIRKVNRAEIIFWSAAVLLTLLLSFGKYFPLYSVFWHLPVVNSIRNPNKFLQVFQICLGILSAYGLDALFSQRSKSLKVESRKSTNADLRSLTSDLCLPSSVIRTFFWFTAGVLGLLTLWALSLSMNRAEIAAGFAAQGWPGEMAGTIVANQSKALWHAVFMAGISAVVFALFSFKRFEGVSAKGVAIAAGLVLIVAADAVVLSKHYIAVLPQGYIEENAVTRYLKEHAGPQRIAMVSQDGFYNVWLTYLFPYHQIPAFNITQMPRMPQDYKQFLDTVGRNPLRMWQLSAVGFLLGPAGLEKQLPADRYVPVLRYDALAGQDGSLSVRPNEKGSQTVLRCLAPAPRYALVGGCEKMSDENALKRLGSNDWKPFEKIILPAESSQPDPGGHGFCGQVEVLEYRQGRALLKVQADAPGFLRVASKYDPNWRVRLDGAPAELLRADFIFQAVYIPAGVHEVELKYSPGNRTLWLQFAGMAVCAGAAIYVILPKKKKTA